MRSLMDHIEEVPRADILGHWDADMGEMDTDVAGFRAMLRRHPDLGVWLGYVGIPLWRPLLVWRACHNSDPTDFRVWGRGGRWPAGYLWFGMDFGWVGYAAPIPTRNGYLEEGEYGDAAMMLVELKELLDRLLRR